MIKLIILILSLALGFVTTYFCFDFKILYLILVTFGFTFTYIVSFVALFFILWGISVLFVNKKVIHTYSWYYRHIMLLLNHIVFQFFNIKKKLEGKELLKDIDSNFILVCNHISNLDSVFPDHYLKKYPLIFIGKKDLFSIPFVGKTISGIGYLPLVRDDFRQELKTMKLADEILKNTSVSIGVYPEGTRNKNHEKDLLEFKSGCFKLALNTNKPIVISVIKYAKKITGNPFIRRKCHFKIVKVLTSNEYKDLNTQELSNLVKQYMQEGYNNLYV